MEIKTVNMEFLNYETVQFYLSKPENMFNTMPIHLKPQFLRKQNNQNLLKKKKTRKDTEKVIQKLSSPASHEEFYKLI